MKAFFLCLSVGAVIFNITTNPINTAKGLEEVQQNRTHRLCPVNRIYCS
tara:strand:+ start:1603 stop:1749 length:147 start_codon:yes stop_codon:yes gene_type:complete